MGIAIGELHGIVEMQKMCNDVATKADWGHRLSKLKVLYTAVQNKSNNDVQ